MSAIVNSQENACKKSSNRILIIDSLIKGTSKDQSIGAYLVGLDQLFAKVLRNRGRCLRACVEHHPPPSPIPTR
jgi:hypothetical protein